MPEPSRFAGILLAALGGVSNGSFALPMKLMKRWKWEHTWLAYSVVGMVLAPWIVALLSTPHLGEVVRSAPLVLICGFGFAWGLGSVFFGLGLDRLGMGLGLALMMGIIAGVGSLVPLLLLKPGSLATQQGMIILVGNVVLILGISLCARAGDLRIKQQASTGAGSSAQHSMTSGLIIAILAGLFSSMLNFAFAFSGETQRQAVELGASPVMASMSVWALAISAGFLANLTYCLWRIRRSGWSPYRQPETDAYWLGAALMGVLWFGGILLYGVGASQLGSAGPMIGWPIMMGATIVASNIVGGLIGEWKGAGRRSVSFLTAGIVVILVAMVVIAQGNAV
jgi:L-rhamnose-H+ transport protein